MKIIEISTIPLSLTYIYLNLTTCHLYHLLFLTQTQTVTTVARRASEDAITGNSTLTSVRYTPFITKPGEVGPGK